MSVEFEQNPVPASKKGIAFAIETVEDTTRVVSGGIDQQTVDRPTYRFAPEYYPRRFNQTNQNELQRNSRQCDGEDVYIKNRKNGEFHVNGEVLARNVSILKKISKHSGPVDLISPLVENGGVECVLKKSKIGEITGYDPHEQEWKFSYTLDLVSTGGDEDGSGGENQIVSELVEE